jgi:hypothetical protein
LSWTIFNPPLYAAIIVLFGRLEPVKLNWTSHVDMMRIGGIIQSQFSTHGDLRWSCPVPYGMGRHESQVVEGKSQKRVIRPESGV